MLTDLAARQQQVHDGMFRQVEDVPQVVYTVTISFLMQALRVLVVVPGERKQQAVRRALEGPVAAECPAAARLPPAGPESSVPFLGTADCERRGGL